MYLYLKLEPLQDSNVLWIAAGSSDSLKKAWYSTHIFQKDLHTSRLAMQNSSVSLQDGWTGIKQHVDQHTHTREQSFIHSMQGVSKSNSHPDFVVQLDEEMFAFEAQLADLSPAECVDLGVSLHNTEGTHVN